MDWRELFLFSRESDMDRRWASLFDRLLPQHITVEGREKEETRRDERTSKEWKEKRRGEGKGINRLEIKRWKIHIMQKNLFSEDTVGEIWNR